MVSILSSINIQSQGEMVLGHSVKSYRHMMKNLVSSLIQHERIETTHAKAKRLAIAANKLINYAKRAEKGETSPLNLLKGRVVTEQVMKKLLMETVPNLEKIPQNYVNISKIIRYRRGDNAPIVNVTIRASEKEEIVKMQLREQKQRSKEVDIKAFSRRIWTEEKSQYEQLIKSKPQQAEFFKKKLARVEYDLWALDKGRYQKRVNLLF